MLVAETMLAQTQTVRVARSYPGFLGRFPTPAACAKASLGAVLEAWSGLGYNRRARSLHEAARSIVTRHGGSLPQDLDALLALPGVGPYTARAVLAFAFGFDVGVVDTNVGRVLARAIAGRSLQPAEAQRLADSLVPTGIARSWNLAVMDLGSEVCAGRPRCSRCALGAAGLCVWADSGFPAPDPAARSAGASGRQPRFAGSDRAGRGALVRAALAGPIGASDVATAAGWPDDPGRTAKVVAGLVAEGLLVAAPDGSLHVP